MRSRKNPIQYLLVGLAPLFLTLIYLYSSNDFAAAEKVYFIFLDDITQFFINRISSFFWGRLRVNKRERTSPHLLFSFPFILLKILWAFLISIVAWFYSLISAFNSRSLKVSFCLSISIYLHISFSRFNAWTDRSNQSVQFIYSWRSNLSIWEEQQDHVAQLE